MPERYKPGARAEHKGLGPAEPAHDRPEPMSPFSRWLVLLVAVVAVGFVLFLVTWDLPAPVRQIERPIPDERLPR